MGSANASFFFFVLLFGEIFHILTATITLLSIINVRVRPSLRPPAPVNLSNGGHPNEPAASPSASIAPPDISGAVMGLRKHLETQRLSGNPGSVAGMA